MSKTVFFPDNENFKNRNFPMLHRLMRDFNLEPIFDAPPELSGIPFFLKGFERNLDKIVKENRYLYNIDLFEIVASDYRKYINSRSLSETLNFNWDDILNERLDALDQLAIKELLYALNKAQAYIEYYRDKLFVQRPMLVFVFGGSKIYQRACLKICEIYNLNTFVLEYFFTGKHIYIEPQFTPIQNNKNTIKRIYTRATKLPKKIKPIKMSLRNLNVQEQPNTDYVDDILESTLTEKLGCVYLQVFDDYSLTNISNDFVLAKELDELVSLALENNDRVLLKLHPFESTKHGEYPTKTYLESKFFEEVKLGRLYFVEGMRDDHISRVDNWYGIVSQYALNLILLGLNPKTNDAFFFNDLFEPLDSDGKLLLLHEIAEHGFFSKSERSYEDFLDHVADNLLPSIGCSELDIEVFFDQLFVVKKILKVDMNTVPKFHEEIKSKNLSYRKIRNAIRLALTNPRSFKVKLLAKIKS